MDLPWLELIQQLLAPDYTGLSFPPVYDGGRIRHP
jgi:hypothetical protein